MILVGLMAMQSSAALTPEAACGPAYHVYSPEPHSSHPVTTITLDGVFSNQVIVEGVVTSKRAYSPGSGVNNDVTFKVTKILKGSVLPVDGTISIHVPGGYAASGDTCWRDTVNDGGRVEVGTAYLVLLTKEAETSFYRSEGQASWFRISADGSVIPVTPALAKSRALSDKKLIDFEEHAKRPQ
jgi:hypothetical protein